jgi:hypothetical protein
MGKGARITTNAMSNLPEDLMAAERELLTLKCFPADSNVDICGYFTLSRQCCNHKYVLDLRPKTSWF